MMDKNNSKCELWDEETQSDLSPPVDARVALHELGGQPEEPADSG